MCVTSCSDGLSSQYRRKNLRPARVYGHEFLFRYYAGETAAQIARELRTTRGSVGKWVGRALAAGPEAALKDLYHRPKEAVITEEARAWVVSLACSKPKDPGYAAEL